MRLSVSLSLSFPFSLFLFCFFSLLTTYLPLFISRAAAKHPNVTYLACDQQKTYSCGKGNCIHVAFFACCKRKVSKKKSKRAHSLISGSLRLGRGLPLKKSVHRWLGEAAWAAELSEKWLESARNAFVWGKPYNLQLNKTSPNLSNLFHLSPLSG